MKMQMLELSSFQDMCMRVCVRGACTAELWALYCIHIEVLAP